jgi:general secretion pathway protein A
VSTAGQPERVERYEPFFGLNEAPFSLAPDPRFLFASASLSAALAQLAYALERREPLVVVTGEIGTGKTLLCRAVLQRMQRKTFLSVIYDPLLERDDLLKQILEDFGIIAKDRTRLTETTRHELVQALEAFLRSLSAIQAHAVVIIDEAQHLQPDVLEQIRLLSNIDDGRGTLLQIILVGQPELNALLARPELRQLEQRVSRRFRLAPLTRDEVHQYIDHRLALARDGKVLSQTPGATELANALAEWSRGDASVEFTPEALQVVAELSGGLPRVINLLCDRSLEEACASRLRVIDVPLIHVAARALGLEPKPAPEITPEPFWSALRSEPAAPNKAAHSAVEAFPVEPVVATSNPVPTLVSKIWLLVSALAAAVAVFVWLGTREARSPAAAPRPAAASPASPATATPRTGSGAALSAAKAPAPQTTVSTGTPAPPAASAPAAATPAAAAAPTAAGERFDIVVASFRTEVRAAAVAAEVAALGLPMRRRALDGWQQVVSGPFASRTDAEDAQQRLLRAGLGSTQIVRIAQ